MEPTPILPQQRRENPEPTEKYHPIPWAMLLLVALMTAICVVYVATDARSDEAAMGDQRSIAELSASSRAESTGQKIDAAAVYAARCAACHQASGLGIPGAFPPLVDSEWLVGSERRLIALVMHGVTGPITVKGKNYSGAMPPFGSQLNDDELAALLSYLRSTWGSGANPVTREAVAQVRRDTQARTTPYSGEAELGGIQ